MAFLTLPPEMISPRPPSIRIIRTDPVSFLLFVAGITKDTGRLLEGQFPQVMSSVHSLFNTGTYGTVSSASDRNSFLRWSEDPGFSHAFLDNDSFFYCAQIIAVPGPDLYSSFSHLA